VFSICFDPRSSADWIIFRGFPQPASSETTSEVTGSVTDSTGAAVPEATVVITSVETNARRQTRTNEAGLYRLTFLPPGAYEIAVQRDGFRPVRRSGVRLEINQT
jgi:protocatechuate 3,4-dioxygenase beta subunit